MINLKENEHIENISENLDLIVSDEYTFGTDALILARFSLPKKDSVVCDFGTGSGIIPFYWKRESLPKKIYALDIQENAIEMLKRSIEISGVDNIVPINRDLKDLKGVINENLDLISMNPPYTKDGAGLKNRAESARIARHEVCCSFDDIAKSASKLLKFGGKLDMCVRPERLIELISSMKKYKIEPKRLRFASERINKAPFLALIEGRSGGNPGLTVEPELYIKDGENLSKEMLKIIGSYKKD